MASHQEFIVEWAMLDEDCNNWTLHDLQLAAELGRSLLERNEELENEVKTQQILIDDQAQEIEFLGKQVASMKEENLTRSKFYEQLETSIFELETTNTQLIQKSEMDKKRILSMCENIDYLERKCEELSGTLDTIKEANKKRYNHGKFQGGGEYLSFNGSSDSSEDDIIYHGGYRKRAQSLQDLRDFTPSPSYDELDPSHSHSNSPDLKTSENEFIQTLEGRIEELIRAKKKESDKTTQLESQLRVLIQENANLQQQLSQLTLEKEEQISEIKKQFLDQSFSPQYAASRCQSPSIPPPLTVIDSNKFPPTNNINGYQTPYTKFYKLNHEDKNHRSICKRCSMEINVLNLVNSIEYENDDYSSLEFELARASESLSTESSSFSSIDNPNFSPVTRRGGEEIQEGEESAFEPGFLDYFFGTNSILKKIHLKRTELSDYTSMKKKGEGKLMSYPEEQLTEDVLDSSLLKDVGIEKYEKILSDDGKTCPMKQPSVDIQKSSSTSRRKLKLPDKIPDDYGVVQLSNFDENVLCDSAEVTVGVKVRSKLWWVVWFVLMVAGTVQVLWQTTRLLFWFILTTILPRSSSVKSQTPPPIRPSSIFANNDFKTQCSYFSNSRLPKLPSSSFA